MHSYIVDMKTRGQGRPPTRRPDLVVFNTQMSPEAKARLKVLAQLEREPAYVVLEDAFWRRWKDLSDVKRERAEMLLSILGDDPEEKPPTS